MKIEALVLNQNEGEPPEAVQGFWERQFMQVPTSKQRTFDWAYGVAVPLVCVAADPIVFTEGGMLETYSPFAYVLSVVSIMGMAAWLLWGDRIGWLAAPLAGLFLAGSAISYIVGVILLPYSLLGMLVLIGFLGFTPIFSGVVYLRNGIRAIRSASEQLEPRVVWQATVLAALFALVIPFVVNVQLSPTKHSRTEKWASTVIY